MVTVQTKLKMGLTRQKLEKSRRDKLYELIRLARRLRVSPSRTPNGVTPMAIEDWNRAVESLVFVGHRKPIETDASARNRRPRIIAHGKGSPVKNKVRTCLCLWDRFLFLLAQLREEEFASCYRQDDNETVCLTVLDFPTFFVPTRALEAFAKHLLPKHDGLGIIRRSFEGKGTWKSRRAAERKRWEVAPRFRRWIGKLPEYLEEVSWDGMPEPEKEVPQPQAVGHSAVAGNGSGKGAKVIAKKPVAKKKRAAPRKTLRKASGVKKRAVRKVTRARAPRKTVVRKEVA